jgi:hypothetical protein
VAEIGAWMTGLFPGARADDGAGEPACV